MKTTFYIDNKFFGKEDNIYAKGKLFRSKKKN